MKPLVKLNYLLLFFLLGVWSCEPEEQLPLPENKLEAKAGSDQQVVSGTIVRLDGSASTDGNGQSFTFAWTLKSKPAGSAASLDEASTASPSFTPDVAGTYVAELKISNADHSATDELQIIATDEEPAAVTINEDITEDRVLEDIFSDPALADYIVNTNVIVYASLTIQPGVRIEFEQDKGLIIYPEGSLIARGESDGTGTSDKRIQFTGKTSTKGFWKGILFLSNNPLNEFENVTVAYAGSSPFQEEPGIPAANVTLAGSAISGAALKVSESLFYQGAGYGMYVAGMSELTKFKNNYYENNTEAALYLPARQLHMLDFFSHFTGDNGFNGIETGGLVKHGQKIVWPAFNDGSGYYVSPDISVESEVYIQDGATLEFKEGLVLRVMEEGSLSASGTEANKITFTAYTKTPEMHWGGVLFTTGSELNKLHYAEISYAGNFTAPGYEGLKASVAISTSGKASIEHTSFKHGLGWGLVAFTDKGALLNDNVLEINSFENLPSGHAKLSSGDISLQQLKGEWLDEESFTNSRAIDDLFYDQAANRWFRGADSPWSMAPPSGFGLKVDETGNYLWVIAENGPVAGCGNSYSAEFIKGNIAINGSQLQFTESYWRSLFFNPCDESQSVDTSISPGTSTITFKVKSLYDMWTGEAILELSLFMPDGFVINYYKK